MGVEKTIVVIEDNEDLASALHEALSKQGYSVYTASSGEEGVELIHAHKPSLLLLDTILPQMSGIEVLEALEEYRRGHELNVIILSNVDDPKELKIAREHNINEYLIKTDWRMQDVIDKIEKYA